MIKYEHLTGKTFVYGSDDCLGTFRAFYKDNFRIEIPDYARPYEFWKHGLNLFDELYYVNGFRLIDVPLKQLRPADAIFMQLDAEVANHCAVYIGDGKILHHAWKQFSKTDQLGGKFRNNITHLLRHKDIPDLTKTTEKVDVMDFLLPHKRQKLEDALAETS